MQFIKGGFAHRAGKELGFNAPVWERGFSEVRVRDAKAFQQIRQYIADNRDEERFVRSPAEYSSSSSNPAFTLDEVPQRLKPQGHGTPVGTSEDVP